MQPSPVFVFEDPGLHKAARAVLRRLPPLTGAQVAIRKAWGLTDSRRAVHAGSFLRNRVIAFDCTRAEFPRVFAHEVFHFVWVRRGNAARLAYEQLVRAEWLAGAAGELGWSAEWRKLALGATDVHARTRRWREYCCESFCDTAAWLYSGVDAHPEFTLGVKWRAKRRAWFAAVVGSGPLPI